MAKSFDGCRVVLTGAAGGVGKAVLRALASEGARICATDLSRVDSLGVEIASSELVTIAADVTKSDEVGTHL